MCSSGRSQVYCVCRLLHQQGASELKAPVIRRDRLCCSVKRGRSGVCLRACVLHQTVALGILLLPDGQGVWLLLCFSRWLLCVEGDILNVGTDCRCSRKAVSPLQLLKLDPRYTWSPSLSCSSITTLQGLLMRYVDLLQCSACSGLCRYVHLILSSSQWHAYSF